jgi:predicted Fe-S protein YdhL (DUF1289 family)
MQPIDDVLLRLANSRFRSRFRLGPAERAYFEQKGRAVVLTHGRDFVHKRLAAAEPANDGRQTPMRGHPVFVAQHATATCCRGCLETWHGVAKHRPLEATEIDHILALIARWLDRQVEAAGPRDPAQPVKPGPVRR